MLIPIHEVLLVEDNHDDIFLMQRAVRKAELPWNLHIVTDGQQALDYMAGLGNFAARQQFPFPSLIFLDLKLPYVSGFEVLAALRREEALRSIPIVILTSSPEDRDQEKALQLGAIAYRVKPPTPDMLRKIAEAPWVPSRSQP